MPDEKIKTYALTDPRTFDGDPFDVAERAVLQANGVLQHFREALEGARVMSRNAELERQLLASKGEECDAEAWENGPQGRKFLALQKIAVAAEAELLTLSKAAGYNPKRAVGGRPVKGSR